MPVVSGEIIKISHKRHECRTHSRLRRKQQVSRMIVAAAQAGVGQTLFVANQACESKASDETVVTTHYRPLPAVSVYYLRLRYRPLEARLAISFQHDDDRCRFHDLLAPYIHSFPVLPIAPDFVEDANQTRERRRFGSRENRRQSPLASWVWSRQQLRADCSTKLLSEHLQETHHFLSILLPIYFFIKIIFYM